MDSLTPQTATELAGIVARHRSRPGHKPMDALWYSSHFDVPMAVAREAVALVEAGGATPPTLPLSAFSARPDLKATDPWAGFRCRR